MIAVIYHPQRLRGRALREVWHTTTAQLWLPTTGHQPGDQQAKAALTAGAQRILVAGGDGTVRAVLGALAGSAATIGILPVGTGNVLARNLGIPLGLSRATRLAQQGQPRSIDLIAVQADTWAGYAATLSGVGADAAVVADTLEGGKRLLGPAAYAVAGVRHLRAAPRQMRLTLDGGAPIERAATVVAVGNVARLWPGVCLLPDAHPSDGLLDVLVASPRNRADVVAMAATTLARAHHRLVERFQCRTVTIELAAPAPAHADGEPLGQVRRLSFEVTPGVAVALP